MTKPYPFIRYTVVFFMIIFVSCDQLSKNNSNKFQIISEIENNKESPFYIDFKKYPGNKKTLPIGVFDSGTGGLTVLNSILELDKYNNVTYKAGSDGVPDFNTEKFIYLADEANMPYGKYSSEGKTELLQEHVIKDVGFLLGNKYYINPTDKIAKTDKEVVKAIVIACNTATAFGLEVIDEAIKQWGVDIEVIGIIEAGSKSTVEKMNQSDGLNSVVGVLATEGTCTSNGYLLSVKKNFKEKFGDNIEVIQQAGVGLAAAIDGDLNYVDPELTEISKERIYHGPSMNNQYYPVHLALMKEYNFDAGNALIVERNDEDNIVDMQLNSIGNYIKYCVTQLVVQSFEKCPDRVLNSVILGCTHYPFFEKDILDHLLYLKNLDEKYNKIIDKEIILIDPAEALAMQLFRYLSAEKIIGSENNKNSKFFISVPNPLLEENEIDKSGEFTFQYKYGREPNSMLQYVKRLPFSDGLIDKKIYQRIEINLPYTYYLIRNQK
ncbi:glutamate racemase [Bacteroidota bacterium]